MYIKKYSTLIIINLDESVKVKQFENSTEGKLAYQQALADGLDAYYYFKTLKQKALLGNPLPIEVTL